MPFRADVPYNDLPLLPPAADLESRAILKACIAARAALAEVPVAGRLIPNQAILINAIPLLEAQASSEIENIVTTTDRLFQFARDDDGGADPATKEALRYRTALRRGFEALARRPVSAGLAVEVCTTIKGVEMDVRAVPGTALLNQHTGRIVYTPPVGASAIRDLLGNWERWIHETSDLDPLIRMAVMHYQFEAIHPFTDGNGRTGRILNLLFLVECGLIDVPILYLSRRILETREEYYRRLMAVTVDGDWETWILYNLDAVRRTAEWTTQKVGQIRSLMDDVAATVRASAPRLYSRELVEVVFVHPYCRIGDVVAAGIAKRQTAAVQLKTLADIGILKEIKAGREKLFVNPRLIDLLAERSHEPS